MTVPLQVSVILCTHDPNPERLQRTLRGLQRQTLSDDAWETVLVDNASPSSLTAESYRTAGPANLRLVPEPKLGLTHARCRGFAEARASVCVLVDDDNVLAPDYLAQVVKLFTAYPKLGAAGGRSLPEFERAPDPWQTEFFPLLALRDLGKSHLLSDTLRPAGAPRNQYPDCAPIGAGMGVRRALALESCDGNGLMLPDRQGNRLSSAGDNDLVFGVLRAGWQVGYFPELTLTHLIPSSRLTPEYLGRLNRGIQQSWVAVLHKYDASPWPPIARWTLPLRQAKAWLHYRAWSSPAANIRWQGACGHFIGRAFL
jgi:glycosyltransferase involved in cell wall biosynthesis